MKNPIAFPIISRLASGVAKFFGALRAASRDKESNVHTSENLSRPLRVNSFRETTRDILRADRETATSRPIRRLATASACASSHRQPTMSAGSPMR
jgi:hypothetical protein